MNLVPKIKLVTQHTYQADFPSLEAYSYESDKGQVVKALYNFDAEAEDEMTIKVGEHFLLLGTSDEANGWYNGKNLVTGQVGLFPISYVENVSS